MGTIRKAEQQRYTYDQGRPDSKDPENEFKDQMPCVVSSEHAEPGLFSKQHKVIPNK